MILIDVNILAYSFREDAPDHPAHHAWLQETIGAESSFGLSDVILSGFLRIVTHPRIFNPPTPVQDALEFTDSLLAQPNCLRIAPGFRHWDIFTRLCRETGASGNLIADAYIAAMAIESGAEVISTDRDFNRFPGVRWRPPF